MGEQPAILLRDLTKSYGSVQALRGVNLTVEHGAIFGFLGPNGAGKTTTIRCLLDLIRPNGGSAQVLGIDPQQNPIAVRSRVGYLPGELRFYENTTVAGILRFLNDLRNKRADWAYIRQLMERLQLDPQTAIKNLSKGNKQKVGIVQALMHRPELLILDEPTSGLDPLIQQEVLQMVVEARHQGATVFFSSHILSEVQEIADKVAILRQGQVMAVAAKDALLEQAVSRLRVIFKETVDPAALAQIAGVTIIASRDNAVTLQVTGDMEAVVKGLAGLHVSRLETERPSLEEIFLAYYR